MILFIFIEILEMKNVILFYLIFLCSSVLGQPTSFPTVAAPNPPLRDSLDVISIYSDSYNNHVFDEYFPNWGQSTTVSEIQVDGNNVWQMHPLDFVGIAEQDNDRLNLSTMEKMYIDYWSTEITDGTELYITLDDPDTSGNDVKLKIDDVISNTWRRVTVDLTEITTNIAQIAAIVLEDNNRSGGTFFVDNWYFAKNTFEPTPPITQNINITIERNSVKEIQLLGTDVNTNDVLTYEITTEPSNGSYSLENNTITYTPNTDFTGMDTFTYIANDGTFDSNESTITINVFDTPDISFSIDKNQIGEHDTATIAA